MDSKRSNLNRGIDFALAQLKIHDSLDRLSPAVRIVAIVHAAQGIIDNGGFQYFFENDFPDNPPYSLFTDAYREIGAHEAAETIAAAVSVFSFPDPHLDKLRRNQELDLLRERDGKDENAFEKLSKKIWDQRVWELLEQFILAHAAEFSDV